MTELDPHSLSRVNLPVTRIRPDRGWILINFRELWQYRELLGFLAWRDIAIRYKQTILGASWAVIQPFFTMVVFSIFFGNLAKIPSDGVPYPLFSFAALVPWAFFANGLQEASNSLVGNSNLLTKVYFPRLIMPIAAATAGIVDFIIAFFLLLSLMAVYGRAPTINIVWLPLFLMLALGAALGVGFWLAALNVQFRDIRYVIPFLIQFWLFATPIAYPSSLLAEPWHTLYGLNPMVGVIEGFRWALLGTNTSPGATIFMSAISVTILFISGAFYFQRMESTFADVV
jgi:lipopolysaccharide transport system permease protein